MNPFPLFVVAAAALWVAGYAQLEIARYTALRSAAVLTRTVLIAVGLAFGFVAALNDPGDPPRAMLAFVIGFGAVHFPAAFILFVKHARGAGKS